MDRRNSGERQRRNRLVLDIAVSHCILDERFRITRLDHRCDVVNRLLLGAAISHRILDERPRIPGLDHRRAVVNRLFLGIALSHCILDERPRIPGLDHRRAVAVNRLVLGIALDGFLAALVFLTALVFTVAKPGVAGTASAFAILLGEND